METAHATDVISLPTSYVASLTETANATDAVDTIKPIRFNPATIIGGLFTLSNSNQTGTWNFAASQNSSANVISGIGRTTIGYFEVLIQQVNVGGGAIGEPFIIGVVDAPNQVKLSNTSHGDCWDSLGNHIVAGAIVGSLGTYGATDVLMFACDPVTGTVWEGKNGAWLNGDPVAGTGGSTGNGLTSPCFVGIGCDVFAGFGPSVSQCTGRFTAATQSYAWSGLTPWDE